VLYPIGYGLWLARHPDSYVRLVEDPIFTRSVINTLVFLIVRTMDLKENATTRDATMLRLRGSS